MRYAIRFNTTSTGLVLSYSLKEYTHFLKHVKNAGYRVHLSGFITSLDAELMGNSFVGLHLTDPDVAARLKNKGVKPTPVVN